MDCPPALFNLVLEEILKEMVGNTFKDFKSKKISNMTCVGYSDEVLLISTSQNKLREWMKLKAVKGNDFQVNKDKTAYQCVD